ncbi:uncharacterized protein LOC114741275 [Neltuma alba]|uniref:uncharacterized protein LOC114741275 n=1 Tax=Neltuma alba TaxID=207710 RepID=UPI0010A4392A|nr:uncharacterized protein LOC114741275 [Prosopis alba]
MSSQPQEVSGSAPSTQSVRSKADPAWEHCVQVASKNSSGKPRLRCLYCAKEFGGGGIHRMKQHLAGIKGDIISCKKVPGDVRFRLGENLKEIEEKKGKKQDIYEEDNPYGPSVTPFEGDAPNLQEVPPTQIQTPTPTSSQQNIQTSALRPSQAMKRKPSAPIDKFFAPRTSPGAQPGIRSAFAGKEAVHRADLAMARWLYDCCIPINAVNSPYFQPMIDAIAAIGPGYKGPSYHAFRTKLLQDMKKEVQLLVDECRGFWAETGCTIMADGWQDQRNRQLINFLVYCPRGIVFIKSVDASDIVKDAQTLCNLFLEMVTFVGVDNVVHLVTDNAANYKAAGRLLTDKHPSIYWSPCAAHCLNLILADIGKMALVTSLASRASKVSKFIYNHAFLLAWLRKREGWKEIIRPGPTQFATTFIALKSLLDHKHDLQALVTSKAFLDSRYCRDQRAKDVTLIILDNKFWNDCKIIVEVVKPLVRLLRIVDSDDRPSLGYIYEGMYRARKAIKSTFMNKKTLYKPYTRIIKRRWDTQLRQDLHTAAYVLNPAFLYDQANFSQKPEVMNRYLTVINRKVASNKTKFLQEGTQYQNRSGSFSHPLALESAKSMRPDEWWRYFGGSCPNVKKLAIQLLSQTASSSGCERNWSVFERIHSKKRNRLEHKRLNDLVFVHYNFCLRNRVVNKNKTFDPIDYESIDKIEYWITEEVDSPPLSTFRADEIEEDIIYDDTTLPMPNVFINEEDNYEERGNEAQVEDRCFDTGVGAGVDLGSFSQQDIDSHSAEAADPDAFLETHAWLNQDPPIFDKS